MAAQPGHQIGDGPFTLPVIAHMLGAEYRTLKSWEDRQLIQPSIRDVKGTGRANLYSQRDACIIRGLYRLRRAGLDMQALRIVAVQWWKEKDAWCPACQRPLPLADEMEVEATNAD